MNFDETAAFKLSKFKIPKKVGAAEKTGGVPTLLPSATTTKKLYHKGAASTTTVLKPYLKPRPQKIPKSAQKKKKKDPLYTPFKSGASSAAASASAATAASSDHPHRQKNDRYYEDLYDNVELEQQFILRLPAAPAASLRSALQSEAPDIKDRLGIDFQSDLRKASVRWDGYIYPGRFQNLPSIVESYKTVDNKTLYKTADLSGVLTCRLTDDFSPPQSEDEGAKEGVSKEELAKRKEKQEKKHFNLNHGLTPPLKNVRKRRFRKVLKKKYETAPEIEKEVRRLFRMDNEAFTVDWELIPDGAGSGGANDAAREGAENAANATGGGAAGPGGVGDAAAASSGVQIEDIFGGQLSSSDSEEDENWEDGRTRTSKSGEEKTAATASSLEERAREDADQAAAAGLEANLGEEMAETAVSAEELQESLRARDRMDTLRRELEEVRRRRRKQEAEIETLENPILKGRFIADLKSIQDEEAAKEAEYQELAAAFGEY